MLLISGSLALLVVFAGVMLLIQVKKEALNQVYRFAAWCFMVSGLLMFISTGAVGIALCFKYGAKMMKKEYKMKGRDYHKGDYGHMWYNMPDKMMTILIIPVKKDACMISIAVQCQWTNVNRIQFQKRTNNEN